MRRLWRPVPPSPAFPAFTAWLTEVAERAPRVLARDTSFPRHWLDRAVALGAELGASGTHLVVQHGDLHHDNILSARREPWLAIDPKPVLAEREFSAVALLRDGAGRIEWRLDFVASRVGLDRDRTRRWSLAHTIAWAFAEAEARVSKHMVEIARRLHAA